MVSQEYNVCGGVGGCVLLVCVGCLCVCVCVCACMLCVRVCFNEQLERLTNVHRDIAHCTTVTWISRSVSLPDPIAISWRYRFNYILHLLYVCMCIPMFG